MVIPFNKLYTLYLVNQQWPSLGDNRVNLFKLHLIILCLLFFQLWFLLWVGWPGLIVRISRAAAVQSLIHHTCRLSLFVSTLIQQQKSTLLQNLTAVESLTHHTCRVYLSLFVFTAAESNLTGKLTFIAELYSSIVELTTLIIIAFHCMSLYAVLKWTNLFIKVWQESCISQYFLH